MKLSKFHPKPFSHAPGREVHTFQPNNQRNPENPRLSFVDYF